MTSTRNQCILALVLFISGLCLLSGNLAVAQTATADQSIVSIDERLATAKNMITAIEDGEYSGDDLTERYDEATRLASSVLSQEPLNVTAGYLLGRLAIVGGRPRDALPRIEAYANDPIGKSDWYAHKLLGDLYILSYPKFAKASYTTAVQLAPGEADSHLGLANANIKLNRAEDAIESAREAVRLDTQSEPEYRVALAEALLLVPDKTEEASRVAQEAVRLSEMKTREKPGDLVLLNDLKTHYELLVKCLSAVLNLYPERADNIVLLSKAWQDQADLEHLITYHSILQTVDSSLQNPTLSASPELLYEQARLNHLVGRKDEAINMLKSILQANPGYTPARQLLSEIAPAESAKISSTAQSQPDSN